MLLFVLMCEVFAIAQGMYLEDKEFEVFKARFGKSYLTEKEEKFRLSLFVAKMNEIRVHNLKKKSLYQKGINFFSDMTVDEKRNWFGLDKGAAWSARNSQTERRKPVQKTKTLPDSLDWRDQNVITPVKYQGSCGSCWAHGSIESIESYVMINSGLLFVFSVQQMLDCAANSYDCGGTGGCAGSIPELAFNYVQLYGITTNASDPYLGTTSNCSENYFTIATISGYEKLPSNDYDSVMTALVDIGPLTINVDASNWHDYESGIYDGCSASNTSDLNHVVQLVGYGYDSDYDSAYFLVRNSWGTSWGEHGYIRLKRTSTPTCATDITPLDGTGCKGGSATQYVCGECGVLFDVSYPLDAQLLYSSADAKFIDQQQQATSVINSA